MIKSQTLPTMREVALFLTTEGIPYSAVYKLLANFSGHIDVLYDDEYVPEELARFRITVPVLDSVGADIEIDTSDTGVLLGADTTWELRGFLASVATTTGATTHRVHALYENPLGVGLRWEEPAAVVITEEVSYPYGPGPVLKTDAAGKLYLQVTPSGGAPGDGVSETVIIDLAPMIGR